MPYCEKITQNEAGRLIRGDLVHLDNDISQVFQVDLTPRQDIPVGTVRLHSYKTGTVMVSYERICADETFKQRLRQRPVIEFSQFDIYFARDSLPETEQLAIKDYLNRLCRRTGYLWKPENCRTIPNHTEEANEERELSLARDILREVVPKKFIHNHFFWVTPKGKGLFVIDPTGVPHNDKAYYEEGNIVPFFGMLENANGYHRIVYEKMEDMDDWNTRDLPPGFHP